MGPLISLCSPFFLPLCSPSDIFLCLFWFCFSLFLFFLASFSCLLLALLFIPHLFLPPCPPPIFLGPLFLLFICSSPPPFFSPPHSSHSFLSLLLCVSVSPPSGEIVMWDLTRTGKSKWTLFGTSSDSQSHNRIVFNMSSVLLQGERELLISTSMDREVCPSPSL